MACRFEVTLSGEDAGGVPAARQALVEATRLDERLSVFLETSEISGLNRRAADGAVPVSAELFALLRHCERLHAGTDGAFDITSTPLSRCWGFLSREAQVPDADAIASARAQVGMEAVELDEAAGAVRFRRPGMELNLGSIGKGYAVDRIAAVLGAAGVRHALVSAGGSSVRALGGRGGGWRVDVTSRAAGPHPIARLRLRAAALSTSGVGEQWVRGSDRGKTGVRPGTEQPAAAKWAENLGDGAGSDQGQTGVRPGTDPAASPRPDAQPAPAATPLRYGHVIDPRTGWPAQGLTCATVVTTDAARADALATAFLVGGEALARQYCDAHPGTLALLMPDEATRPLVIGSHPGAHVEEL